MKKLKAAVLAVFMAVVSGCVSGAVPEASRELFAMDTIVSVKAYGALCEEAVQAAADRLSELERVFSVTREDSDIARINGYGSAQVSDDTANLIGRALEVCDKTGGALDITIYPVVRAWGFTTGSEHVPTDAELADALAKTGWRKVSVKDETVSVPIGCMLDLGSCAKGYAGDELAKVLSENGVTSAIISLGGNVRALGSKPDGSEWLVGITDPFSPNELLGTIKVRDKSVVTSGGYQRYFVDDDGNIRIHIIDPSTGMPVDNGLQSVTVIGSDGMLCDALSTALFVMGREEAECYWRENGGFEMILVTGDGEICMTAGIAGSFTSTSPYRTETIYE